MPMAPLFIKQWYCWKKIHCPHQWIRGNYEFKGRGNGNLCYKGKNNVKTEWQKYLDVFLLWQFLNSANPLHCTVRNTRKSKLKTRIPVFHLWFMKSNHYLSNYKMKPLAFANNLLIWIIRVELIFRYYYSFFYSSISPSPSPTLLSSSDRERSFTLFLLFHNHRLKEYYKMPEQPMDSVNSVSHFPVS